MSVLVLDLEVYEAVYDKAWAYGFHKTCDINYCHTLSTYSKDYLQSLVKNWLWLNEMSWIRRYEDGGEPELPEMLKFNIHKSIDTYQMLKFLQCIDYNIEIETIKTGKTGMEESIEIPDDKMNSYKILQDAISEISQVIISQLPEYKNAKWSSLKN